MEPTHYDPDIKEAYKRLRPYLPGKVKRRGVAVVLALASWADAGDTWAGEELERHVTRDTIVFLVLLLEIIDYGKAWQGRAWGAEGAMGLLRCTSRIPAITEILREMR